MIKIPHTCPRGRDDCISLSMIGSDDGTSFFCCGENNGDNREVEQDRYTTCFKGEHRDEMAYSDKRDLVHQAAVLVQALAVVERHDGDAADWSAWTESEPA